MTFPQYTRLHVFSTRILVDIVLIDDCIVIQVDELGEKYSNWQQNIIHRCVGTDMITLSHHGQVEASFNFSQYPFKCF